MKRRSLTFAGAATLLVVGLLTGCGGDKPDTLVASARANLAKGDRATAVVELRNVLQKNPDLAEARYLLGKALFENEDYAGAQKELRRARGLGYSPDSVIPLIAESMLRQGEFKRVIAEFGQGTKDVTSPEARAALFTTLGKAQQAAGDSAASKAAFDSATAAKPDYAPARSAQAVSAATSGDAPTALALVDDVLAKDPGTLEAWQLKGDLLQGKGKPDEALAAYRKGLDANPNNLPAYSSTISLLARQGKFDEASKELEKLKKIAPKHPETLYLQAQLAYWQNDTAGARDAIQQVLKVAPDSTAALLLEGAIAFDQKSYAQAESSLNKVLAATPDHRFARRLLIGTYLRTGQPGKALGALKPVLASIDDDPQMLQLAGEVQMQNGNAADAARYFQKAAALDPKSTPLKTTVALAQLATGDTTRALPSLQQASVEDSSSRADLALIAQYVKQRDFAKALAAVDALEKKQPKDPLPHRLRGEILAEKGDLPGARKSFERALEINPTYFPAAERLARLDLAEKKPDDAKKRMEAILAKDPKQTQAVLALAELQAISGGTPEQVTGTIGKAIAANPTDAASRLALINYYLSAKEPKKAIAAALEAQVAMPERPEILEALARAYLAAGDPNQAIATYGKWARSWPDSPVPLLRMGEVQRSIKDNTAALDSLRRALALKPDLLEAQREVIALEIGAGHTPQALAIAADVQKQRPKEAIGWLFEGDIYAATKDWSKASASYREGLKRGTGTDLAIRLTVALQADGKSSDAERYAAAWIKDHPKDKAYLLYVADDTLKRNEFARAHQYYRALNDIEPNNPVVLNNLAWTGGRTGDPKAIEYAERANKLSPNQPPIMETLGTLLVEKGDVARGVDLLRNASAGAPDSPTLRLSLAKGLIKANQKDAARKELEVLAKLGDKFAKQDEVSKLMKGL